MKYVIDIDGTLCTNTTNGNYSLAKPIIDRIKKINSMYDDGDTIVLYTARGMNTFQGDVKKVYEEYYDFTVDQLKNWNVKYHQLILGKPSADLYVDDKGVNDNDFFK